MDRIDPAIGGPPQSVLVAGAITRSGEAAQRLVEVMTAQPSSEPNFWPDFVARAAAAHSQLIDTARAWSAADAPQSQVALRAGLEAVTEAMQEMAAFVVAAPAAVAALTARVTSQMTGRVGPEVLAGLLAPWSEPDAVAAMRDGYRIALQVLADKDATELFLNTSPQIARGRVGEEFPALEQAIVRHIEEYGWLRTQGYRYEPLAAESLVYRIQLVLLRWRRETIEEAAGRHPLPAAAEVVPVAWEGGNVAVLQSLLSERRFRVDGLLQAECLARPFLRRIAEVVGCPLIQVLFAEGNEIFAALAGQQPLPLDEIDRRAANGAGPKALTGMTVCRGTAVGRVRLVVDQDELGRLEVGDVLVTAASTIDPTDQEGGNRTVFPTRSGGPNDDTLQRAVAVVADEGGLLSHAAIVCRERGLPAVLGTEIATTTVVDGQIIEVDATKPVGIVIPLGFDRPPAPARFDRPPTTGAR